MSHASDEVVCRIPVEVEPDAAVLAPLLDALSERKPTGTVALVAPFGFSFRDEPQVFYFVAIGACLGMAILMMEFSFYVRHASFVAHALAVLFFTLAAVAVGVFVRGLLTRVEIVAEGGHLEHRVRRGSRVVWRARIAAESIVAVLVVRDAGRVLRVVLAGPRHTSMAVVYRSKILDPESFAPWYAEMVSLVARAASSRDSLRPSARSSS